MKYEIYAQLRDAKGMKDFHISKATGIASSTLTDWKKGRSCPKQEKLIKIAAALGMSYAEFVGIEIEKAPVPKFEPELIKVTSLFSQLTDEEKQLILDTMTRFVASHK